MKGQNAHLAERKIMRCIRSGAGVCGKHTLHFVIDDGSSLLNEAGYDENQFAIS